ncbi:hypothetical protein Tco_1030995 [Tanacetum coccineum]|uniref:Uncharacterized protein n=1 Tax=Tanacetum coccineum TaxID=301880 RepID=A0ABQ5G7X5_9ASTR
MISASLKNQRGRNRRKVERESREKEERKRKIRLLKKKEMKTINPSLCVEKGTYSYGTLFGRLAFPMRKLSNLERYVIFDFGVALRMFTKRVVILKWVEDLQLGVKSYQKKLNITKPDTYQSDISKRTPYTTYYNPPGVIYVDKYNRNMLMRMDELYKQKKVSHHDQGYRSAVAREKVNEELVKVCWWERLRGRPQIASTDNMISSYLVPLFQSDTYVFTVTMEILPEPTSNKLYGSIVGEPLSPDRVFDFPMDELEPHPAYDFFAPGPLPGYAGNPNNNNGWIEVDVPLLGELGAEADEPMVSPVVDEIAEPIVEMEEQVITLVIDMKEDLAMLFGDDDFSNDDSEGFEGEEEVWEVNEEWLMAPVTPPPMPVVPPPSTYEVGVIEDLSTRMGNLEYGHGQLVKKVIQVSDAEVADGITIGEIGPRVSAVEGQVQVEQGQQAATQRDKAIVGLSQQVQTLQAAVQQRDVQIQQLQTMVSEMSSRESTLMQCILGMDKRLAGLERRPPGPQ